MAKTVKIYKMKKKITIIGDFSCRTDFGGFPSQFKPNFFFLFRLSFPFLFFLIWVFTNALINDELIINFLCHDYYYKRILTWLVILIDAQYLIAERKHKMREKERMDFVVGCGPIFAKSSFFLFSSLSFIRDDGSCNAQTNKQKNTEVIP